MPLEQKWCVLGIWLSQNTNKNPMFEVEFTGNDHQKWPKLGIDIENI